MEVEEKLKYNLDNPKPMDKGQTGSRQKGVQKPASICSIQEIESHYL